LNIMLEEKKWSDYNRNMEQLKKMIKMKVLKRKILKENY